MKKLSILLFMATVLVSCTKLNIEKGTPKCVEHKIKDFNKSSICNNVKVEEYTFQGNIAVEIPTSNRG
jgi:hypothetical protein